MIGLVAGGDPRDAIAQVLERARLALTFFDSPQAVLDALGSDELTAIVVWVESALASMPSLVEPLTKRFVPAPVVMVCANVERREVRAALAAGVAGVVVSANLDSALVPCLQAVVAGQACVPREHWREIEPPVLSTREKQILGLVVMGYMNGQIAEQLFLAESTVKSHLSSAFGKLGVRSRNEAVRVILDPERGLGMGILGLGGEPLEPAEPVG